MRPLLISIFKEDDGFSQALVLPSVSRCSRETAGTPERLWKSPSSLSPHSVAWELDFRAPSPDSLWVLGQYWLDEWINGE